MVARHAGLRVSALVICGAVLAGCTDIDAEDQKVIDRLKTLDVLTIPAGATELSRTETKGGGNELIRTSSFVKVVYASPLEPARVGRYYLARFSHEWSFKESKMNSLRGWSTSGHFAKDAGTIATVEVRPPSLAGVKAPDGAESVVTVDVSATRPG